VRAEMAQARAREALELQARQGENAS